MDPIPTPVTPKDARPPKTVAAGKGTRAMDHESKRVEGNQTASEDHCHQRMRLPGADTHIRERLGMAPTSRSDL
ncbi:hypothetical protein CANTEDRAFT_116316 [Yamadazyma tenuis ATCC 10573]|uniref:Uncharacterized protein n=1 Tax=Candida tenuis (strain ATCC 10573 / BCRC 21748 / CBS 615 / JCM 9827 / NBRC 10315 / NRRL Y-1498 / VKM Y-70) TaxID=590646 RepID=G3BD72_CANTC|nr:uncharacterized protein CANTEDRAFT_116316 [Yamadazyma tenuis ATCC 10573]EGV60257.1 hypothetical protein CANTEDRAFT_116316 [Yamadazyma tenuis ATCC 10573]